MFIIPCSCFLKEHSHVFHANLERSATDSEIKAKSTTCSNQTTLHLLKRSVFADNARWLQGLYNTTYCDWHNTFAVPFSNTTFTIFVQNWVKRQVHIF